MEILPPPIDKMTPDHEAHLSRVKHQICAEIDHKYRIGQKEHGGSLWLKPGIIQNLIEEITDLVVYALTLREQYETLLRPEQSILYFTEGNIPTKMCPNCGSDYKRGEETPSGGNAGEVPQESGGDTPPLRLGDEPSRTPDTWQKVGGVYVGQPELNNGGQANNISTGGVEPINRSTTGGGSSKKIRTKDSRRLR